MRRLAAILAMLAAPAWAIPPQADDFWAAFAPTTAGAADVRDGLVVEWTFNETLTDTINGWTLVETNSTGPANVIYEASPRGYAVNLFTNTTRFTTTNIPAFTGEATVVFLLKLRNATGDANNNRLCKIDNTAAATYYPYTDGRGYWGMFRSARVDNFTLSGAITRTNWHLIAVTTKTNGQWEAWQNATKLTNVAAQTTISIASPMAFGVTSALGTQVFDGWFDEVRFYNRQLSAAEIEALCQFWGVCDE